MTATCTRKLPTVLGIHAGERVLMRKELTDLNVLVLADPPWLEILLSSSDSIFTRTTSATFSARNTSLEALAVFLDASRFYTAAAVAMSLEHTINLEV